ncbi:glycoside hydrolase family 47 protein [Tricholoma matsutake]|nr:glycoside hydrolase family 47 protein [Tricholoma matsutake 945]
MVSSRSIFAAFFLSPLVFGRVVQLPSLVVPNGYQHNLGDVKKLFVTSYQSYHDHAFKHDDLLPLTNSSSDGRNGWGATIVDGMDTMFIMGLDDYFNEAITFASAIDFSKSQTSDTVSVFETTIRYLGGLLSAYEISGQKFPTLCDKAKEVADKMTAAWVGNNSVPFGQVDFSTNTPTVATSNIAEAGTLTLEWAVLSKYVGDDKYRLLAEKSVRHIAQGVSLPAQGINPTGGTPVGGYVTWGGGSDSYFEYLIKYARLNNTADNLFADTWRTAVDSSITTLLKTSTSASGIHTYLADYDDSKQIRHVGSHLACFSGGNWLLGGLLLNNDTVVKVGLEIIDGCWNTYASTATGIGPEVFAFTSPDGSYTGDSSPTADQLTFNSEHGFYITVSDYILRPEVLESNFYAWRATGDTKYLDRAASAIESFNQYLSVNGAFAGLDDVNSKNSTRINTMESFWFAEVLKYLYLTFDDPSRFSLDNYVFNTEAHPFKVPPAKDQYGSVPTPIPVQPVKPFVVNAGSLPIVSAIPQLVGQGLQTLNDILHL